MPTSPDHFVERIQSSVLQSSEDDFDVIRCRLSKECDELFSDRKFVQKLNDVFP